MERILGIDTGTNSLGWAIVDKDNDGYHLIDKGVNIFQEGVKVEKGIESSKAADRTAHHATRIKYYRRKLRKIQVLRVLADNHLCPPLSKNDLSDWRLKKIYPINKDFLNWQHTDDVHNVNPYHFRYICVTEKLDLSDISQRYILGRAFYHIAQRRGFLSNRKDTTADVDGLVKNKINALIGEMYNADCQYLGEFFYKLYRQGDKIRNHYTARKEHYLAEFHAICDKQQLDHHLIEKLEKAIFYQRPLKSQKGRVGFCTFEKNKSKCPSSHPLYEEYRMLCFINNIKIRTPEDNALRPLTQNEKAHIKPLFYRKSKKNFKFEDIAKELAGKNNYGYYKTEIEKPYLFNYYMDTTVSSSPVTAQLRDIFGNDWLNSICECYTLAKDKTQFQILNDIWHVLFFFDDDEKLKNFGINRLQLNDEDATRFGKINISNDYAALSLKAIRKILPYLRKGLLYSHAVFLGNLSEIIPHYIWEIKESREAVINGVNDIIINYDSKIEVRTIEQCIKDFLKNHYEIGDKTLLKLYHPSMMELYPKVQPDDLGLYQLKSPRINSLRNPMAMRSMFRLRKVVNLLLKEKRIDENTIIHIEFARELNDANRRKAYTDYQRANEKDKEQCRKEIKELYKYETGLNIEPTDVEVLKFQLWKEQDHKCLYTGDEIALYQFIGGDPSYDIEHTVPQSMGGDSTKMNLTLCQSHYNRYIKGNLLPFQLREYETILQRIGRWKDKYEELDVQIRRLKGSKAATKEQKDAAIQKRHRLEYERDYWRSKYNHFKMTEIPDGFSRRQGTDISVISRYGRLFLKSVFPHVYIVKGLATSDFRKIWGIQQEYKKKERINHIHHCIDAITIACIGKNEYDKLARYYHEDEEHKYGSSDKPHFERPWPSFVEDIKHIQENVFISHYTADNLPKQDKKYVKTAFGNKYLTQGDTARGSLHNDTYYGAIMVGDELKYVVRKKLSTLEEKDIKLIVDDVVRAKIEQATTGKNLKEALAGPIWMNEEKGIEIKKVRCYTPSVTCPLNIRYHRDPSVHDYKRQFNVTNDRNYMLAIYIGKNNKGKETKEFELVNNLDAAAFFKKSNDKIAVDRQLVPIKSRRDFPLAYCLKIGTMVMLYEKSPEEIWKGGISVMTKRLYKVIGLSILRSGGSDRSYGTIHLLYHQEARQSKDLKMTKGAFKKNDTFRPSVFLYHTQINALVEGYDFKINDLGEFKRLR